MSSDLAANKEPNLKSENSIKLWAFLLSNGFIVVVFFYFPFLNKIIEDYNEVLRLRFILPIFSPLILFIIGGVLSSNQKAIIVFWRLKNYYPGCKAFTHYGKHDLRVDMGRLAELYDLPNDPKAQNSLWFRLYRKHSADTSVLKSHRDFLAARDMAAISVLFVFLLGIPYLFFGLPLLKWMYLGILIGQYFLMVLLARNFGQRFVVNVLALESAT
jgi:hypothetical protein